jgi:hypothetical protein
MLRHLAGQMFFRVRRSGQEGACNVATQDTFSTVPLRLASFVGMATGLLSVLFGTAVLINRLFPNFTVLHYWVGASPGVATLLVFLSFALSILFMWVGVIGEYLIVLLQESKRRPAAVVSSVIGELSLQDPAYALFDATGPIRAREASRL